MATAAKANSTTNSIGEHMNVKSIAKAYNSVKQFNKISGVLDNPTLETLNLYNSLAFEELCESIEAFEEATSPSEILKEAIDELYVLFGKLQILEALGMNVEKGIERVCENNLSKFVPLGTPLWYDNNLIATINEEYKVVVLKDENGKIRKFNSFEKIKLDDLVPQDFFKHKEAIWK